MSFSCYIPRRRQMICWLIILHQPASVCLVVEKECKAATQEGHACSEFIHFLFARIHESFFDSRSDQLVHSNAPDSMNPVVPTRLKAPETTTCLAREARKKSTNATHLGAETKTEAKHRRHAVMHARMPCKITLPFLLREIAVKRFSKTSRQGLDEFKNEVSCIAKLQHRNLVRFLGSCIEDGGMLLIYEHMPNKSLDSFIFDKVLSKKLDWPKRNNIVNGADKGLQYLHQDSSLRIIHGNFEAGNILLDHDMSLRISDFGGKDFRRH
ncbi:hypothetical protein POM88_006647 [Heracleum sosnowskyi]|uniref:non-specific serine/threonine protein kinase n=1 Tax=Heracleum sosnowskyi TaxID=360622 RepID=A0AAD8N4Y0_9APIA|nr:hypothetical protein POM88_006647 [Heracleum sosnowskyi]